MKYLDFYRDVSVGDEPTDINFTNHYLDDKSRLLIKEKEHIYSKTDILCIDRIIDTQLVDTIKSGAKFNRNDLRGLNIKIIKQSYNALLNKGIIVNNVMSDENVNYKFLDHSISTTLKSNFYLTNDITDDFEIKSNGVMFFDKVYLRKIICDEQFTKILNDNYICNDQAFISDQITLFNPAPEVLISINIDDTLIDDSDKIVIDNSELVKSTKNYIIGYKLKSEYEYLNDYFNMFLFDDKKSFSTYYIDKKRYVDILTDRKIMTKTEYLNIKKMIYNHNTKELALKLFFDYHFDTRLPVNDLHYSTMFFIEYAENLKNYYNNNSKSILTKNNILIDIELHIQNCAYLYNFYTSHVYNYTSNLYKINYNNLDLIFGSDFSLDIIYDYFENVSGVLRTGINNLLRNETKWNAIPTNLINGISLNVELNLAFFETYENEINRHNNGYNKKLLDFIEYYKERKNEAVTYGFDIKVNITENDNRNK